MALLDPTERPLARCLTRIVFANPFHAERVELERRALGPAYVEVGPVKALLPGQRTNPNTALLEQLSADLLARAQERAAGGGRRPGAEDRELVSGLALFTLYHRFLTRLEALARGESHGPLAVPWYPQFQRELERCLSLGGERLMPEDRPAELLALFFQFARAFGHVFRNIVGRSPAAERLRGEVWQSIFTHDLARYRRLLAGRMADIATLVTGPSGTGKELVARAVGLSGHVPFNEGARRFELDPATLFLPVNLSAFSPTLIESELFGHRRGSFTGALENRVSWLELCAPHGTVFLDELAEIDATIQVKLLRVVQTRQFQRLGELEPRRFKGRLVSATNRDLTAEIAAGRFREDLYWRLCSDKIVTPRLADLIGGRRDELEHLVGFVAESLLGVAPAEEQTPCEAHSLASEVCEWVEGKLGLEYPWPGNFRELEQCARSVLIRGSYVPEERRADGDLSAAVRAGRLNAEELLCRYCAQVYEQVGTYEGAARRLGLDRRTVKAKVLAVQT